MKKKIKDKACDILGRKENGNEPCLNLICVFFEYTNFANEGFKPLQVLIVGPRSCIGRNGKIKIAQ